MNSSLHDIVNYRTSSCAGTTKKNPMAEIVGNAGIALRAVVSVIFLALKTRTLNPKIIMPKNPVRYSPSGSVGRPKNPLFCQTIEAYT